MARIKYYYDTETCKYERLKVSAWDVIINTLGFLFVCLIFSAGLVLVYMNYFQSPREAYLEKENAQLELYYELLSKELDQTNAVMAALKERDDNIYRVIFEAEPTPIARVNYAETAKYKNLLDKGFDSDEL